MSAEVPPPLNGRIMAFHGPTRISTGSPWSSVSNAVLSTRHGTCVSGVPLSDSTVVPIHLRSARELSSPSVPIPSFDHPWTRDCIPDILFAFRGPL